MTYCIAVFRSRSQAIDCKNALARAGIWAEITATPAAVLKYRHERKRNSVRT